MWIWFYLCKNRKWIYIVYAGSMCAVIHSRKSGYWYCQIERTMFLYSIPNIWFYRWSIGIHCLTPNLLTKLMRFVMSSFFLTFGFVLNPYVSYNWLLVLFVIYIQETSKTFRTSSTDILNFINYLNSVRVWWENIGLVWRSVGILVS